MPAYHVERSTVIPCDTDTVFDTVADFGTWTKWSPWLTIDKNAVVKISDDSSSVNSRYGWQGEIVGQGEMEHIELNRPTSIVDELRIRKPFKSKSGVGFKFEPVEGGTQVTWTMDGHLPWFMFWMKSMMQTFLGMDYERGLRMLREYIETGNVVSRTEVIGVEPLEARDVWGIRSSAPTDNVGPAMRDALESLHAVIQDSHAQPDELTSVYHPCNIKLRRFEFTAGYTVAPGQTPPTELSHCHIPAGNFLHVRHTGCYENLGNAWSGAHQYAQHKKIKLAKKQNCFEVYRNSPESTAVEDLLTDIYLPLR